MFTISKLLVKNTKKSSLDVLIGPNWANCDIIGQNSNSQSNGHRELFLGSKCSISKLLMKNTKKSSLDVLIGPNWANYVILERNSNFSRK